MGAKFITITLIIFLLGMQKVWGQTLKGTPLDQVLANGSGELTMVYVQTPAFVYKNENGELTGICIEIMDRFMNYMKQVHGAELTVNYVEGDDFSDYLNKVKSAEGGVFGLANTTITEERKQEMNFSAPYITNIAVLVTHASLPELNSFNQLEDTFGKTVAYVPEGTTHEKRITSLKNNVLPNLDIIHVNNSWAALDKVIENVGAFSYQDIALYWDYKQQGKAIQRHPIGDQSSEKFGIVMPLDSEWPDEFQKFFTLGAGFRSTATYREILVNHLGDDVLEMLQMAAKN